MTARDWRDAGHILLGVISLVVGIALQRSGGVESVRGAWGAAFILGGAFGAIGGGVRLARSRRQAREDEPES